MQVTSDLVNSYIEQRQQEKAADATINRELAALRRMFKLGAESNPPKVLRVPKFPKLHEENVRIGSVEDSHYGKLRDLCARRGVWLLESVDPAIPCSSWPGMVATIYRLTIVHIELKRSDFSGSRYLVLE